MDLQAHSMIGSSSPRWAKMLALFCFAIACGLLIGTISKGEHKATIAAPTVGLLTLHTQV